MKPTQKCYLMLRQVISLTGIMDLHFYEDEIIKKVAYLSTYCSIL